MSQQKGKTRAGAKGLIPETYCKKQVSKSDLDRLTEAIRIAREIGDGKGIVLGRLLKALRDAEIMPSSKMPKNIVTMNSAGKILWLDTQEVRLFWLGFPEALNHDGNKVSIFSSLGIALLGARVGEDAAQEVPTGHRLFKVIKLLYQPEAKKDYHL
ncbi:MAG TPA: GreA/GreB family elongation factor [Candidatus Omnitrophota bacterium]|nr:GreA/GreB family elongation factor [Candidatus Omnitrophota bacterium]HRY85689.1 GreA/GreB family elongation factor [Candidatus Omnitrophota bacterium]